MKNDEYITVKEFANRAGVSVQSVYQRLNTTLKDYSRIENGLKTININALEELYSIKVEQVFNQAFNEPLNKPLKSDEIKEKDDSEVLFLRNQVEQLQMELTKERQHSRELAEKIAVLADQAQKLQLTQMNPQLIDGSGVSDPVKPKSTPSEQPKSWWGWIFRGRG